MEVFYLFYLFLHKIGAASLFLNETAPNLSKKQRRGHLKLFFRRHVRRKNTEESENPPVPADFQDAGVGLEGTE